MYMATTADGRAAPNGLAASNRSSIHPLAVPAAPNSPSSGPTDGDQLRPLPDGTARNLVQLFKLLSDESRLKILCFLLQAGELNVRSLCALLGQSQPAVSHHLALLRTCGLIELRRDGKSNFYRLVPEQFGQFTDLLFHGVPGLEEDQIDFGQCVLRLENTPHPAEDVN